MTNRENYFMYRLGWTLVVFGFLCLLALMLAGCSKDAKDAWNNKQFSNWYWTNASLCDARFGRKYTDFKSTDFENPKATMDCYNRDGAILFISVYPK